MAKKKSCPRITKAKMGARERSALARVLKPLVREGICTIDYDPSYDVFFFRGKQRLAADVRSGYVLSVTDAKAGAWQTIHEPPSH